MKDRLLQIMQNEGLSPSRFAESIGIKRSAMSHYMTGRNDPGLDVVRRIYEKYSYVNLDWLLTGSGVMTEATDKEPKEIKHSSAQLDFFTPPAAPPQTVEKSTPQIKAIITPKPVQAPVYHEETRVQPQRNAVKYSVSEHVTPQKRESKNVTKIMLFYSDDTFETFIPEKTKKDK